MSIGSFIGTQLMEYFRRRIVIFSLVLVLFALGLVAGGIAVGVVQEESRRELSGFLSQYVSQMSASALSEEGAPRGVYIQELLRSAGLPWILGLSIIGAPVVLGIVFLRGFALGFTLVLLFDEFSYTGILLAFAGVLPHTLLAVPALFLVSGAAVTFSVGAAKALTGHTGEGGIYAQFAGTTLLCGMGAVLILAATWIQSAVSPILVETVIGYVLS